MSQVDSRNSFAGKRARTDGGRREDDWTCPSCGNVNFSFRTTCNMRNCTQSRPVDHNVKSAPKSLQGPPPFASGAGYAGSAVPSSVYGGAPYGPTYYNGSPLPPYDLPAGGSGYPYGYGGRLSVGSPYGPLHMSGPPPYSGGMYGMPPLMDRYGMGMHMGHGAMGPSRPIPYPDEDFQKKPADARHDNDWICPNCGNRNFAFRNICNMRKCNTPRPGNQAPKSENLKGSKPKMPDGSWKCEKCNNINYPFRTKCNRQNCGAERPSEGNEARGVTSDEDEQSVDASALSQPLFSLYNEKDNTVLVYL
ncbi:hypothetical protein IEQ34_008927 [Dendrobium chrysotoxum]|uniref:RanBP2-type domain-containing protein n=1 Tax=Dendrobium chrysotoxum TaxID=161865 RepID=A0AAV7GXW7_DENCH|nr:hypothetical protein IEQ34_008927 [Dendrobium chrysotoxum]